MFLSESEIREAFVGSDAPAVRVETLLASASGIVARLAPAPDPVTEGYRSAAKSSEFIVAEYLWETGGYVKSSNTEGLSDTYGTWADVEGLLFSILGNYYQPTKVGGIRTLDLYRT